jgi:ribonuclease P/MRP protein subunit RPP1
MCEFVDLGLYPAENRTHPMVDAAVQLGYTRVGLETVDGDRLDLVKRADLHPRNQNELGKQVRKLRYNVEVISVQCINKSVSRQAARDPRIDLLRFPISGGKRDTYLDRQQAGLMRDSGVGYEVRICDLLVDNRFQLMKRIGAIKKSLDIALKHDLPVVASSGARDVYGMRDPYGLASLLSLLGLDLEIGLNSISTVPNKIIIENRAKLSPNYVVPGVWIEDN